MKCGDQFPSLLSFLSRQFQNNYENLPVSVKLDGRGSCTGAVNYNFADAGIEAV